MIDDLRRLVALTPPRSGRRPRALRVLAAAAAITLGLAAFAAPATAQDDPETDTDQTVDEPGGEPSKVSPKVQTFGPGVTPGQPIPADFSGTLQVLHAPGSAGPSGAPGGGPEIFPDAGKVFMSVRDIDAIPVETARRGGKWLCSSSPCTTSIGDPGQSKIGDEMLRSIKLQSPMIPLPLTIWGRVDEQGARMLDFDPVLLGRRSYSHICAYKPVDAQSTDGRAPKKTERVMVCRDSAPVFPSPDSAELTLGLQWPKYSEMANFKYLAIVDSCGNARVQPFQRTFTVPVFEVASGGCGQADGKILRVFPSGGWIRVTAFNLDQTAAGNVVNATYRVSIPPLENLVESNPAKMLFPDPQLEDLKVDCGPQVRRPVRDRSGIPVPPMSERSGGSRSLGASLSAPPGAAPALKQSASAGAAGAARTSPSAQKIAPTGERSMSARSSPSPTPPAAAPTPQAEASGPGPVSMDHQSVIIAPEPLRLGNCRIRLRGQTKHRLVAPLALHVSLKRTDKTLNGAPIELLADGRWIVTPSSAEFQLPPISENFDGDSRLSLTVSSDPLSADGKVVLLSDAARVATALRSVDPSEPERARRLIGSVTIHTVPLCGESNFETLDTAGNCLRAYVTIPAMLATLQVTRAPWIERPLVTRSVLSAVGVAVAFDSYNPVERKAFPVAGQVGGFVQSLGDGKVGLLGYVGIAPTIPVLGSGGNTTSFGFLAGLGLEYITNEAGPDEGLKPAAFLSIVVQVGQASPEVSLYGKASTSGGE